MKLLTYLLSFAGLFFLASSLVPAVETVPGNFVNLGLWVAARMEGKEEWVTWQFDQPDRSSGVRQAFRPSDCPIVALDHNLHGLNADSRYAISDMDGQQSWTVMTGHEFMERCLQIRIEGPRRGLHHIFESRQVTRAAVLSLRPDGARYRPL